MNPFACLALMFLSFGAGVLYEVQRGATALPRPRRFLPERVWIVAHRRADGKPPKIAKAIRYNGEMLFSTEESAREEREKLQPDPLDQTGWGVFPVDLEVLPEEKEGGDARA